MSVQSISEQDFTKIIADNPLVVIDFWAPWFDPCVSFSKTFEEVSNDFKDIIFCTINIEENKIITSDLSIKSVPTIAIVKNGTIIFKESGSMPKQSLIELLNNAKGIKV